MTVEHRICAWCLAGYTPSVTSHPRWCLNCACLSDAGRSNRLAGLIRKWTDEDETVVPYNLVYQDTAP